MGQAAIRRKNDPNYGTSLSTKTKKQIAQHTSKPVRMLFAEYFDEWLAEHRRTCTDPKCDESTFVLSYKDVVITPMVKDGSPKEVFLTIDGTPFQSIQLATGDEVKDFFNEDGTTKTDCHCDNDGSTAFIHPQCHIGGGVVIAPLSNGQVSLLCKTCGVGIFGLGPLQAAPRPKAEYPSIFCEFHGTQPSYMTCRHVLEGRQPELEVAERPTDISSGTMVCTDCADLFQTSHGKMSQKDKDNFIFMCAGHLNDYFKGKLEDLLVAAAA